MSEIVLVTGATGYIGGLLIPKLIERGIHVRALARNRERIRLRRWYEQVDIAEGDVLQPAALLSALDGVHTAYYLIHNMSNGRGYTYLETRAAENFVRAAEQAGVQHIIYLGGLADTDKKVSYHMASRINTGKVLSRGKVPVTEFRAGVIVGPGSISFEMIRFMTELMKIIFGPVWLQNRAQPIAVQNVIDYLLAALESTNEQSRVFEIGGPDVMSYADLMLTYGRLRGLWRKYVIVPGVPVWFMALGVEWMTPVPTAIAIPLVDGMRSESVVKDKSALQFFPNIRLIGYKDAVKESLSHLNPKYIEPVWKSDAPVVKIMKHEGFFIDHRCEIVNASSEKVFYVVASLGGKRGWLYANWLWKLRGWFDRLFGGPGMRGRAESLTVGGVVDFYRVEAIESGHLFRLYSELKAPGDGWMEWRIESDGKITRLSQTGFFTPRGLPGFLYWYGLGLFHKLVFRGLIKAIVRRSET